MEYIGLKEGLDFLWDTQATPTAIGLHGPPRLLMSLQ
jgi:hypothetical protein